MAELHKYEVTLNDGSVYDVTIAKHHDHHTADVWLGHLVDVLKSVVAGVITRHIIDYVYKGRK